MWVAGVAGVAGVMVAGVMVVAGVGDVRREILFDFLSEPPGSLFA